MKPPVASRALEAGQLSTSVNSDEWAEWLLAEYMVKWRCNDEVRIRASKRFLASHEGTSMHLSVSDVFQSLRHSFPGVHQSPGSITQKIKITHVTMVVMIFMPKISVHISFTTTVGIQTSSPVYTYYCTTLQENYFTANLWVCKLVVPCICITLSLCLGTITKNLTSNLHISLLAKPCRMLNE